MHKKYLVPFFALVGVVLVFCFHKTKSRQIEIVPARTSETTEQPQKQIARMLPIHVSHEKAALVAMTPTLPADELLFPQYKPLSKEELEKFKVVPQQIVKYFDWGKMDDDQIEAFRQNMWDFGDRGIATLSNELDKVSSAKEKLDANRAKELISYIDFLRYLSQSPGQGSLAKQAVEKLATRPIVWDDEGKMTDPQKSGITLECFQLYSSIKTAAAERFVSELDDEKKPTYIYNYIVGRKLGGAQQNAAIAHAKVIFGDDLVTKALRSDDKT